MRSFSGSVREDYLLSDESSFANKALLLVKHLDLTVPLSLLPVLLRPWQV
jgi:hypothetical protein